MALPKAPIRRRIRLVIMLTSLAVLLITSTSFIIYELIASSQELERTVNMAAKMVGDQTPTSLLYRVQPDAEDVLATLKPVTAIRAAALYDTNGVLFARYPTNAPPSDVPPVAPRLGHTWTLESYTCTQLVTQSDKVFGAIYLRSDLTPVYDRIKLYSLIGFIVTVGSFVVALLLSNLLQRDISAPILKLAEVATAVSDRRDYSVRAQKLTEDELGALTDAFNHMLVQIQDRESALRENADRLRLALQAAHIGAWDWHVQTGVMNWDEFIYRQLGLAPAGGRESFDRFLGLIHPQDRDPFRHALEEAVRSGRELNVEFRVVWPDGAIHNLSTRGKAVHNQAGQPTRVTGVTLDITQRKRAEEAQALMVAIVQSSDDAILAKDLAGRIISWNAGAQRMYGYTAAEIIGENVEILATPERKGEEERILDRIRQGSLVEHYETVRLRKDGRPVEVSLSISPIRDTSGQIVSVSSIARDVTERKRAEQVLTQQAERLREQAQLLDLANVLARELDGRIILWSAGMEQLYGWSKTEALGRSSHELLGTEFPVPFESINAALLENGDWTGELVHRRRNGQKLIVASHWVMQKDDDGGPSAVLEVNNDITARRAAEEEIRRLNAELEQRVRDRTAELTEANRELEAFTYSVSHDLRAPLRHIDAFARIIEEETRGQVSEELQRYVARIRKGTQTMGRLVDDLLNLSRVGRAEVGWSQVDLNLLVDEVISELKSETAQRRVEWRVSPLPRAECDAGLMKQVFANLLSNAVKYSRTRDPAIIEIGQQLVDGQTVVFVRDNGVGFNMKYVNKLFGVFERLHRAEDFEGTGIGLAIVRRIIQKHNGRVWAEAEPEKGATFYVALPGFDHPAHQT